MRRTWIKLWVDQCLRGSMIAELTPEQRWIFVGLLLLAGDSEIPGVVYRRKDEDGNLLGYSDVVLADTLGVDEHEIKLGLVRMVEKNKVMVDRRDVISICNWKKYQSEYERQKPYRNKSYTQSDEVEGEVDRDREREKEELCFDHAKRSWLNITEEDKKSWAEAFPACEIDVELAHAREWLLGAGPRGQKRAWRKFIVGWLTRTQKDGGTRNGLPAKSGYQVSQIGATPKTDHGPEYWAKVRELKAKGIEGQELTDAIRKRFPELAEKE